MSEDTSPLTWRDSMVAAAAEAWARHQNALCVLSELEQRGLQNRVPRQQAIVHENAVLAEEYAYAATLPDHEASAYVRSMGSLASRKWAQARVAMPAITGLLPRDFIVAAYRHISVADAAITVLAGTMRDHVVPFALVAPLTERGRELSLQGSLGAYYGAVRCTEHEDHVKFEEVAAEASREKWIGSPDQLSELIYHWTGSAAVAIAVIQALNAACIEAAAAKESP